jgi:ABC-type methionine transport system ATPase subunit
LNIKDADFRWDSKSVVPTLENINLIVRKGGLTSVMGRVGAGKVLILLSSLAQPKSFLDESLVRHNWGYVTK